jgi:hypothetical protein
MSDFGLLTVVDVITAVRALPDKQCLSDPLPTSLLKENIEVLAPFLVDFSTVRWHLAFFLRLRRC